KLGRAWHFIGKGQKSCHQVRLAAFQLVKHELQLSPQHQGPEPLYSLYCLTWFPYVFMVPRREESAFLMTMAGDSIPPAQVDSLSDDFTSLRKDDLMHSPGSNAVIGGTKNSSVSVDDRKVSVTSALETGPNTSQVTSAMAQGINADIKHQLMKEVRRFGRKYERIFILLEEVQGPLEVRKQFIEFTIKEAARFKRRVLIQYLEKLLEEIESHHLPNSV
uniref:INTS6/SAGE1/DDX26B/CT45 C-terminal domain-containing protein n=1 Tax=Phocoena sinus TaxID=42100 RepID=A0A8C9C276_PHOSS